MKKKSLGRWLSDDQIAKLLVKGELIDVTSYE
jgi:hypothetical protein